MAEIFDFYVNDNRSITFKLSEPIMLEDNGVSDWRFHIPNVVNGLDATGWQWWLVYVNARNDKYTVPLTLEYDYDRPDAYSIATYTVDYGMSCKVGNVRFSLEAIDADTGGTILHEWHTKTYSTNVVDTLQGNQVEYAETESDIISALLIEVRNRTNQLIGGATPTPVSAVSEMLDTDKLYLLTTDGEWYYYNGTRFVPGGVYGAGVVDSVPTQGSTNAVSSGGVYSALEDKADKSELPDTDAILSRLDTAETDIEEIYTGKPESVVGTVNKLNPETILENVSISPSGTEDTYSEIDSSDYIEVDSTKSSVAFTGLNGALTTRICLLITRLLFYDNNKSVLSYLNNVAANTITAIPSGAKYVRMSLRHEFASARYPMVEFVDDISEISPTYVEYSMVESYTHGINYLDQTQQSILNRVTALEQADLSPQVSANTAEISALKSAVASINGEAQAINALGEFKRGNIYSTDGHYGSGYSYRVATPDIIVLSEEIVVTVADGFRLYVTYFTNGTRTSSGWKTGTFELASGLNLRLMVARVTEDTSETADIEYFCSQVTYTSKSGIAYALEEVGKLQAINANTVYGCTWDWWISAHSVDKFGNAYIGYIDTDGYVGVLRRQPDGTMQYKRLAKSNNDDDHNGMATHVLSDGKILVIGAHGHASDNHIICFRSRTPYSIDDMQDLSFDISQTGYDFRFTYSQVFEYNGTLFDFLRCTVIDTSNNTSTTGIICLVSSNNGTTWTPYKVISDGDPYVAIAQATDNAKYLKLVKAKNPASGVSNGTYFYGAYINLTARSVCDLSGTEIGSFQSWGGGMDTSGVATESGMTRLTGQAVSGKKGRLFWTARTANANTVFLFAHAVDVNDSDFTYKLYSDGTIIELGTSGTAFGNNHYISGACFGKDINTIYYAKATTSKADGDHELHKVKISNNAVSSDEIITEASMCILRPIFLGNGELAVVVGNYNDQNSDGTYNGSFTAWELKPMFTRA